MSAVLPSSNLAILIPVYNDWASLALLLPMLDGALASAKLRPALVLVDDASTQPPPTTLPPTSSFASIDIVPVVRNVGHQRAIALGLAWLESARPGTTVCVMDADGEDDPHDVVRLLAICDGEAQDRIVFARRTHRQEGIVFRSSYYAYKALFRICTGTSIGFGNFSVVPWTSLQRLTRVGEIWNNYAAGIIKSKLAYVTVPTPRARRLAGRSHMNFTSLVLHGLSALSVFSDTVAVRAILASCAVVGAMGVLIAVVFAVRLFTDLAIPGWASIVVGIASIIAFQCILLSSIFAFIVLGNRHHHGFQPQRDHATWLLPVRRLQGPAPGADAARAAAPAATPAGAAVAGVPPER
jgi:hypothetical protein